MPEEDNRLRMLLGAGKPIELAAAELKRSEKAITARGSTRPAWTARRLVDRQTQRHSREILSRQGKGSVVRDRSSISRKPCHKEGVGEREGEMSAN